MIALFSFLYLHSVGQQHGVFKIRRDARNLLYSMRNCSCWLQIPPDIYSFTNVYWQRIIVHCVFANRWNLGLAARYLFIHSCLLSKIVTKLPLFRKVIFPAAQCLCEVWPRGHSDAFAYVPWFDSRYKLDDVIFLHYVCGNHLLNNIHLLSFKWDDFWWHMCALDSELGHQNIVSTRLVHDLNTPLGSAG